MAQADRPQRIVAQPARSAIFLVATVCDGAEDRVREALGEVAAITRAVAFRVPDGNLDCIVGIGSRFWDRAYAEPRPAELHPFRPLAGETHTAPSTPGDLLFHVRAERPDLCFELAARIVERLGAAVDVVDEVHGFKYFDERDLLGFVDGTENPTGSDATAAVQVGEEDPAFAGGSYVIVQKYLHDLTAWDALPVEQQELVIGRRKLSDIELPDDQKPSNSHVTANTIVDPDGTERQIVRENMPFGTVGTAEFGTYFIGYAATPDVTERMLRRMFIGEPEGNHDRILDFSTAVTGCLFYVPTVDFLEDPTSIDDPPDDDPPPAAPPRDGSLGIGSLRRSETA